jgi:hypothetical protein
MAFDIKVIHPDDTGASIRHNDLMDVFLQKYTRILQRYERQEKKDLPDIIVSLRLSLMKTLFEKQGFLDLTYIDSIIRQVIENFKNKHQTQIKKEHWGILSDMCNQEIARMSRIEPDEITDPVDIDVDDDDISAWINSEIGI